MTADVSILGTLHADVAAVYRELLQPREEPLMIKGEPVLDKEGQPIMRKIYPSAAELAAVNTFLKNNNITATDTEGSALDALKKQMEERRRARKPVLPDPYESAPPGLM